MRRPTQSQSGALPPCSSHIHSRPFCGPLSSSELFCGCPPACPPPAGSHPMNLSQHRFTRCEDEGLLGGKDDVLDRTLVVVVEGGFGPICVVGVVGQHCDPAVVVTHNQLPYFMRVPGQPVARTLKRHNNFLPLLPSFRRNPILQFLQIPTQIHNPHLTTLPIIIPVCNNRRIIQWSQPVDIISSLYFLNNYLWIFLLIKLRIIIEFGLT